MRVVKENEQSDIKICMITFNRMSESTFFLHMERVYKELYRKEMYANVHPAICIRENQVLIYYETT